MIKSVIKYNLSSLKKHIITYYSIFIVVCICLVFMSKIGSISTSGLEISSVIFIFVVGLNSFKENFYFMKSNNVSRKDFLYGTALSMIPISLFMSFIDIIINRVYNIFIKSPTNYDMNYTGIGYLDNYVNWIQSNSIGTLLNTFTFQFVMCLTSFSLGFLITIIYYNSNKLMKLVVSASPFLLIILLNVIGVNFPIFTQKIGLFIEAIFGWNNQNSYAAVLTFIVSFVIYIGISRVLIRKAVIKQG